MADRISNLLQDYDDLVDAVANATHGFYKDRLLQWFSLLDKTPEFAREVTHLEALNDFDAWYRALEDRQRGHGMGGTSLDLPTDREAALGMQISLFRQMANGTIRAELFAKIYIAPSERNVNRGLSEFSKQMFVPAAKTLRRHLERATEQTTEPGPDILPLAMPTTDAHTVRKPPRRKVFIVHGHDDAAREAVARFLEKIDLEPVILHERPNKGRTIITKFQQEAADVVFAVVLMTPDDQVSKEGAAPTLRARQNVVFELGFFIGALGPERVAALVKGDVERPSDFEGVVYIPFDASGAWRQALGRELDAAGLAIDWNKAMQ
jgi:hypothetical protein